MQRTSAQCYLQYTSFRKRIVWNKHKIEQIKIINRWIVWSQSREISPWQIVRFNTLKTRMRAKAITLRASFIFPAERVKLHMMMLLHRIRNTKETVPFCCSPGMSRYIHSSHDVTWNRRLYVLPVPLGSKMERGTTTPDNAMFPSTKHNDRPPAQMYSIHWQNIDHLLCAAIHHKITC